MGNKQMQSANIKNQSLEQSSKIFLKFWFLNLVLLFDPPAGGLSFDLFFRFQFVLIRVF